MLLGAAGRRGLGAAAWALVLLLAILAAAALGVLGLAGEAETVAGFPVAAVIQVVGLWLLPLPLATLAYALTFDRTGVGRRDLEELRARVAARGASDGAGAPAPGPAGRD